MSLYLVMSLDRKGAHPQTHLAGERIVGVEKDLRAENRD